MRSPVQDPNRTLSRAEVHAVGAWLLMVVASLLLVRAGEALRDHRRVVRRELQRARHRATLAEDEVARLADRAHEAEVVAAEAMERAEHADALVREMADTATSLDEQLAELGAEATGPVTIDGAEPEA